MPKRKKDILAAIGSVESGGNYSPVQSDINPSMTGKYQFDWEQWGKRISDFTGVKSRQEFLDSPEAQEKFMQHYTTNIIDKDAKKLLIHAKKYNPNATMDEALAMVHHTGLTKSLKGNPYLVKDGAGISNNTYLKKSIGSTTIQRSNSVPVNYSGTALPNTVSTPNFAQYPDRSGGVPNPLMAGFKFTQNTQPVQKQSLKPIDSPVFMMDENQLPGGNGSPITEKRFMSPLQPMTETSNIPGTSIPFTKTLPNTQSIEQPMQGYVTPETLIPNGIPVSKSPWLTLEDAVKQTPVYTTGGTAPQPATPKMDMGKMSNAVGQLLPFASNIYNAFQKPGQVPRPIMDNPIALQRVSMANDRNEVERGVRGNNLSFDQTLDAQTAAANKQFTLAQRFNQLSKVNQEERNQNMEIGNRETVMNHNIQSGNNAKMDQFWKDRLDRENVQKSQQSANVANAGDKAMAMYNNKQLKELDNRKIQMQLALDDTGAMERFKKNNPDLFKYGLGGKLYSAGQFKRQTFKRIN
jgi:hypothetical protein